MTSRASLGIVSDLDLVAAASVRDLDDQSAGGSAATPVVTVSPDGTLERAAQLMTEHNTAHLIVVDACEQRPLGVLLDARHRSQPRRTRQQMSDDLPAR